MKARGSRPSAFMASRCLEPLIKHEARVVDITSQMKQYKLIQCFGIFYLKCCHTNNLLYFATAEEEQIVVYRAIPASTKYKTNGQHPFSANGKLLGQFKLPF